MQKIKYLEGLRGVAAMIVFFDHIRDLTFFKEQEHFNSCVRSLEIPRILQTFIISLTELFVDGHLAVWVFWILSSYVISILFFKKKGDHLKILINYFSKRYFRLLIPVLVSVMFAYVLLKCGWIYNHELAALQGTPYFKGWIEAFYNVEPNIFIALRTAFYDTFFDYQLKTTYNAVLWTIQYEYLGSLLIFSIFGVIAYNARRYILYLLIVMILIPLDLLWLDAFVVGHILCDLDFSDSDNSYLNRFKALESKIHKNNMLVFIVSIVLIVTGKTIMMHLNVPDRFSNPVISTLIVYVCIRNAYYRSIFSLRFFSWLGGISFGIYLLHLPVICSLTSFLIIKNFTLMGKISAVLITIPLVWGASVLFTKYVDRNGIRFANKIGNYFMKYS